MSFRLLNQKPIYYDTTNPDAIVVCSGGSLNFYITGTSTPKDVYADPDLGVNNGPTVTLDSAGQSSVDIWGSGEYRVTLKNSAGVTIWTEDNVRDVATGGLTLPSPVDGEFITSDGTQFLMAAIVQVPDSTGNSGKVLGNDGVNPIWQSTSSLNIPVVSATTSRLVVGNWQVLGGSGSAPASGATSTSLAVTFANAFTAVPFVTVTPIGTQAGGPPVTYLNATPTATGFTAYFDIAEGASSGANFTAAQAFSWVAVGSIA